MDVSRLKNPMGRKGIPENARLAVLIVLTLIVIAAIIYFNHMAKINQDESGINYDELVQAPKTVRIPGAQVDPKKLEGVRDDTLAGQVVIEKDAYLHLLKQASRLVFGDMEILGVRRAVPAEIIKDTKAHRGKPYEIKGNLQWYEKVKDLDFELYRGYLTSYTGDYFYFTVLYMDEDIRIGDVVKLQGFFFKRYSFTLPGTNTRIKDAIYLVGKRLVPSFFDMPPVKHLDMNLLNRLYDYDIQDMVKPFEEKPLYHMLSYVLNMDEKTYRSIDFQEILAVDLLRRSGSMRGRPVKILGEIVWIVKRNLGPDGENPVGPRTLYHGVCMNYRGRFCYFLSFERPKNLKPKELVYLKGFFFRNYAYRSRKENLVPAPVVIVKGFEQFVMPKDYTLRYISYAILAGTVLACLFLFIHVRRDRKNAEAFREKFIARKRKLLNRVLEAEGSEKKETPPEEVSGPGDTEEEKKPPPTEG